MTRDELLSIIGDGTIATVHFRKKNGELRTINGRVGVKKGVKGVGKKFKDEDYDIVTIYEFKHGHYRSIKAPNVIWVKAHGEKVG